ncbi:hypothetical protein Daesc_005502 [Daldinia eschscholtzii]|uniref:Dynamin-type G domain-containing protein n=1 Tax=Daldinia eschscholtzii TaxID=292717 RepID=A0AAX6MLZ7_9PEZI
MDQNQPDDNAAEGAEMATQLNHPIQTDSIENLEYDHSGEILGRCIDGAIRASQLAVLNLDLKLGHLHHDRLVHSLGRKAVSSLLGYKLSSAVGHLQSLRARIDDPSSKVLVTGDVNAGKSTFCNALLRRKILPENQQPCTSIFCEILNATENEGLEEVHAVRLKATYDRLNERTYDKYALTDLAEIVSDNKKYKQCKIYIADTRANSLSLLNSGVVPLTLVDTPGLNSHTAKTTAIFTKQEEVDMVIFVLSASNQFTISAKDFITLAAAEKACLFVVINRFDTIKNKVECKETILSQLRDLNPQIFDQSSEFVHFVSSHAISTEGHPYGGSGDGSAPSSGDIDGSIDNCHGNYREQSDYLDAVLDFERLEKSLRNFVVDKRMRSKLAPAKTYLQKVFNDINILATVNYEAALSESGEIMDQIIDIRSKLLRMHVEARNSYLEAESIVTRMRQDVYDYTKSTLTEDISGDDGIIGNVYIPYPGILGVFRYSESIKRAMLRRVTFSSVRDCEDYAFYKADEGVDMLKQLGRLHVGKKKDELVFSSKYMSYLMNGMLNRQVNVHTTLWDFIDWPVPFGKYLPVVRMALKIALKTAAAVGVGWIAFNTGATKSYVAEKLKLMRNIDVMENIFLGASITSLVMVFMSPRIPTIIRRRHSKKIADKLAEIDFVNDNAERISAGVHQVLRAQAYDVSLYQERKMNRLEEKERRRRSKKKPNDVASEYFRKIIEMSDKEMKILEELDLEVPTRS